MKPVRPTLSFSTSTPEAAADAAPLPPKRRRTREIAEVSRVTQQLPDVSFDEPSSPRQTGTLFDLPDLPRHSLTLPQTFSTPTGRSTGTFAPLSPRLTGAPTSLNQALVERARVLSQDELIAAIEEKFTGLTQVVEQLIGQLEIITDDKTPTRAPQDASKTRNRLKQKLSELRLFVEVADKQATTQKKPSQTMAPLSYRQLKRYEEALETYEDNVATPLPTARFSPAEKLLYALKATKDLRETTWA